MNCTKCGAEHFRFRDAEHTKPAGYCNACHAQYMREKGPKYSELSDKRRKSSNARAYANVYQRRGKIIPQPCAKCGNPKAEKHHDDYDRPLDIRWLCRPCHRTEHCQAERAAKLLHTKQEQLFSPEAQ